MTDYVTRATLEEKRTHRHLVTPEGVDLNLRLADGGQRVAAFLLDLFFMLLILIAGTLLILLGASSIGLSAAQPALIIWLLGFFLLRNGYFILMEMGPRAATWGKRICGLRVVARNGGRLTADAVIARNLMREIEVYLPLSFLGFNASEGAITVLMALTGFAWAAIFLFFPLFNRDRLRVGDLLAGTWVIRAPRRKLAMELMTGNQSSHGFTDAQLDAYGVFELQTLETVIRTGSPEAKSKVAETIRAKIGEPFDRSDDAFLRAYYEALRAQLERGLLFGRRRAHKHDR